jgi:hypothetical protein
LPEHHESVRTANVAKVITAVARASTAPAYLTYALSSKEAKVSREAQVRKASKPRNHGGSEDRRLYFCRIGLQVRTLSQREPFEPGRLILVKGAPYLPFESRPPLPG